MPLPADFPASVPTPYSLAGVLPKLNLVTGEDGRYHASGAEPEHRLARYQECLEEIEFSVGLLQWKRQKPKYQALDADMILKMLGVNLVRDRGLSEPEAAWVLKQVRSRIVWPGAN